jgi:chemotaxis protein MotB
MDGSRYRLPIILCTLLTLPTEAGCVTKKKYDALQRELDEVRDHLNGEVASRDERILSLEQALADAEAERDAAAQRVMDLEAQLTQLQDQYDVLLAEKDAAEGELAEALASKKNLKASIEEMKQALKQASERRMAAEARIREFKRVLRKFKPLIDAGKLEVRVVDGRMVLVLPTDVLFASGRSDLSDEGAAAIAEVGAALATFTDRRFQVEGHTDTVPIKTKKYPSNWELASARAMTVVRSLLSAGVPPAAISAASYGEHRPTSGNDSDEGKAKNRRIEIVIVPDLSGLPGFDELNDLARPDRIAPKASG